MQFKALAIVLSNALFDASGEDDFSPTTKIWLDRAARALEWIGGRRYSAEDLAS